ncbi:MAG: glycosyltransferase family 9 protein [Gammaproteobacteria bacterium]|nr:glycosyltransferase family 9 protein [Gammaproteobacteria bacterium]
MNILVIKQTSLGDVLHSTVHIRAIKRRFPGSHLTLLTAASSADIYRNNPRVDELILYERRKRRWLREPLRAARHFCAVLARVRARRYDLAFDLQGLARSVVFLYAARAGKKFVKGNWPRLDGFRDRSLHAIKEMDGVLARAGIAPGENEHENDGAAMEWFGGEDERRHIGEWLARANPKQLPLLVCSPFSRWASKDWPLANYMETAAQLTAGGDFAAVFCGDAAARARIAAALPRAPNLHNLAGELTLAQFAELVGRARLLLGGDSFPMHLACARGVPVVALFAPTDEARTGPPPGARATLLRAPGCARCDRRNCRRRCLKKLPVEAVLAAVRAELARPRPIEA